MSDTFFYAARALALAAVTAALPAQILPGPARRAAAVPRWDPLRYPWPMYGQNPRRTGQSPLPGPRTATPGSPRDWTYAARGGNVINMQPVVTAQGVYFGTWGLLRRDPALTPDQWEKVDGRYYGLRLTAQDGPRAQELFAPLLPAHNPVGYLFAGRPKLTRDVLWCGAGNPYLVSFYNGTIEGVPVVDPSDGTHYVGRGDGKLYAIDPIAGRVRWSFRTFNPELPTDPDGGGEIVGGPLMGPDSVLYFATVGVPWPGSSSNPAYETNAIYAVDRDGHLRWRFPAATRSLDNFVMGPTALSRDGRTLYAATFAGDVSVPGQLIALDLSAPPQAPDAVREKWRMALRNPGRAGAPSLFVHYLAVGLDDHIYCAATEPWLLSSAPALFAVEDRGGSGAFVWTNAVTEPHGYPTNEASTPGGLALRESGDGVLTVFMTTTHLRAQNGKGGALFAIDPRNGSVLAKLDPGTLPSPGIGGMTAPILGAEGMIYAGIRGLHATSSQPAVDGVMYGVAFDRQSGFRMVWSYPVQGQLDWAAPAIGAGGALYFGSSAPQAALLQSQWFNMTEIPPGSSPIFHAVFE